MKICGKNSDNRNAKSVTNAVISTLCPPPLCHIKRDILGEELEFFINNNTRYRKFF